MDFKSNTGKFFSEKEAINMIVSLKVINTNSENKRRGFYNSLSYEE
tara:strand:- start:244 stop:381 length:138 start_codon:yes stop_codon:yes gene_type:complete